MSRSETLSEISRETERIGKKMRFIWRIRI